MWIAGSAVVVLIAAAWGARVLLFRGPDGNTGNVAKASSHPPDPGIPAFTEPVADIGVRLAYEKEHEFPVAELPHETWERLDALEEVLQQETRLWKRAEGLQALHARSASEFVEADGFGYRRMPPIAPNHVPVTVDLTEAPPMDFTTYHTKPNGALSNPGKPSMKPAEQAERLAVLHREGMLGFFNSGGLGLVYPFRKSTNAVAAGEPAGPRSGYRPHGFAPSAVFPAEEAGVKNRWRVNKLELVSLLKHETPRVYVSDSLPRMKELRKVGTRNLTGFEEKALAALQKGADLASEARADQIHLLGSLRAGQQCLDCHEVQRGTLLGAFSYDLRRQPTAAPDAKKVSRRW
jgi:hypothetical protein